MFPAHRRPELIARFLFAGCVTGRRIKAAFGDGINRIVWEECSREISGNASFSPPADLRHMAEAIQAHKPDVVLVFGNTAKNAIDLLTADGLVPMPVVRGPHPAARHPDVAASLATMAGVWWQTIKTPVAA